VSCCSRLLADSDSTLLSATLPTEGMGRNAGTSLVAFYFNQGHNPALVGWVLLETNKQTGVERLG